MDLIDRQAAIDIAKDLLIKMDEYHQYNQAVNNYCAELMKLPSSQPNQCVDAVSRSDVFNAIEDVAYEVDAGSGNWYRLMNDKVRSLVRT